MKQSLVIFISLLLVSILLAYFYRPFIFENGFFDMSFADCFPNLFSVPVCIFLALSFTQKEKWEKRILYAITIGVLFYEFMQMFTGGFDIKDIIATLLGAGIILLSWSRIVKLKN